MKVCDSSSQTVLTSGLCGVGIRSESLTSGTSLVVQWLRLHLPVQGVWIRSMVRELSSHMPCHQKTKIENRSNIVKNSMKTLKVV